METPRRLAPIHCCLVICVLVSILCGLGWLRAQQQKQAVNNLNRDLAAKIHEIEEAAAATRQEADEYRKSAEARIDELAGRVAALKQINEKLAVEQRVIWRAGRGEAFSIIGIMDLDGDGKDNRDQLKRILAATGAWIDNEVDDKGILRVNGKFDDTPRFADKTKFVVVGKIPDIADTDDDSEAAAIQELIRLRKVIFEMARERGIRIVSLSDFLKYIGYKSDRRLFVPGSDVPHRLKSS
jgi:hypothetical protein